MFLVGDILKPSQFAFDKWKMHDFTVEVVGIDSEREDYIDIIFQSYIDKEGDDGTDYAFVYSREVFSYKKELFESTKRSNAVKLFL